MMSSVTALKLVVFLKCQVITLEGYGHVCQAGYTHVPDPDIFLILSLSCPDLNRVLESGGETIMVEV